MIYFLEFDRHLGRVTSMRTFEDHEAEAAEEMRLSGEQFILTSGAAKKILVVQATSEEELRRKYAWYFESPSEYENPPRRSTNQKPGKTGQ